MYQLYATRFCPKLFLRLFDDFQVLVLQQCVTQKLLKAANRISCHQGQRALLVRF